MIKQIALGLFGIAPGGYSGITHISGSTYAVVDDRAKIDGFELLTLEIDSVSGRLKGTSLIEPEGYHERIAQKDGTFRDMEGIAWCPERQSLFISGEEDQRIKEYTLNSVPTGMELNVPAALSKDSIYHNYGFEALCYDQKRQLFWTTTESTLKADGIPSGAKNTDGQNRLRLTSFNAADGQASGSFIYIMDKSEAHHSKTAISVHGVPSILAMDNGKLLVMEREAYVPKRKVGSWTSIKIYAIDFDGGSEGFKGFQKVSGGSREFQKVSKRLVASFKTHLRIGKMNFANYEGMTLGSTLADGSRTIIMIADSQGGAGNRLYHLKDYIKVIKITEP